MSTRGQYDGLPHRVASVRRNLGLAQGAFGRRIGVGRNAVSRFELGKTAPRARTLERIATQGGVTGDWFLRGDRPLPTETQQEKGWDAAVAALRAVWQEPSRRPMILTLLLALADAPRSGSRPRR